MGLNDGRGRRRSLFRDMFSLPQGQSGDNVEGTPQNPIRLPQCTRMEFESLIMIMYPQMLLTPGAELELSTEEWLVALKLSRQWDMPEITRIIINAIDQLMLGSIEKVELGRRFKNKRWLREGLTECVEQFDTLSLEDVGKALGWRTAAHLSEIVRKSTSLSRMGRSEMIHIRFADLRCDKEGGKSPDCEYNRCDSCNRFHDGTGFWISLGAPSLHKIVPPTIHTTAALGKLLEETFQDDLADCVDMNEGT